MDIEKVNKIWFLLQLEEFIGNCSKLAIILAPELIRLSDSHANSSMEIYANPNMLSDSLSLCYPVVEEYTHENISNYGSSKTKFDLYIKDEKGRLHRLTFTSDDGQSLRYNITKQGDTCYYKVPEAYLAV